MDNQGIINLAIDLNKGVQTFSEGDQTFTANEAEGKLREALIAANGGSTVFNYKSLRKNKAEIFSIIEEIVDVIVDTAFQQNNFFNECVDWKNLKKGDKNEFYIPAEADFVVCDVANGINTPRRQRMAGGNISIATAPHQVKMYDEFTLFLAGRIDWAMLCQKVAVAFTKQIWQDIFDALEGITAATRGMNSTYVKTGTYDEDTLLELCAHIEAASGVQPIIAGTAAALRKCTTASAASDYAKDDRYNMGYYGKFNGYTMIKVAQGHKANTDTFTLNDSIIHVIAGGQKFIKFVEAGETYIMDENDGRSTADRTVEYLMERDYGIGIVVTQHQYGKYTISAASN